ncbi:MAG TPA: hypothetical protein VF528_18995 [Pyrinomonadaceae bacterium]|jgi:hypothetical protein
MPDNVPSTKESANQRSITMHAVLIGLTPLIPVPFVDDMVKGYFQRRLVRSLALAHGREVNEADVATLTEERGGGCLSGCLGQVFIFPLKMIFRKVFFFLEWKRAVDLTSHSYHQGYLLDYSLREGWLGRTPHARNAADVRTAIDEVCRAAPIKPVESAIKISFRQSKSMLKAGARVLEQALRRVAGRRPDERELSAAVTAVEAEEEREIGGVVSRLQKSIEAIPDEHFKTLRTQLAARLREQPRLQPPGIAQKR